MDHNISNDTFDKLLEALDKHCGPAIREICADLIANMEGFLKRQVNPPHHQFEVLNSVVYLGDPWHRSAIGLMDS